MEKIQRAEKQLAADTSEGIYTGWRFVKQMEKVAFFEVFVPGCKIPHLMAIPL